MKGKLKFDMASIQDWLLAHGEKVALGLVGVVFLLFVYSAVQRETLESNYQPAQMEQKASAATQHVQSSKWDPATEEVKVVNYAERAKVKALPVGTFALPRPFNPPVADPKAKRGLPEIFAAEELRVAAGMDIFSLRADQPGRAARPGEQPAGQGEGQGALKAQPWAVVTGLVPIEKQREAHASTYAEAIEADRNRDRPQYLQPILERAEIDPANPEQLAWTKVELPPADDSGRRYDIVSVRYIDAALTAPLAELITGSWGESVAHPKIPLLGDGSETRPAQPAANVRPGGPAQPPAAKQPGGETARQEEEVSYLLLRAFDFGVQPGKKYRYRVTLQMKNPNAGVPPQFLSDPKSATLSSLQSEPSEPTRMVTIPDGHDILAGAIDAGSRYTEPTAKILVTSIDVASGLKAATEIEARRGTVANTPAREVSVRHPLDKKVVKLNLPFKSNIMVLDIYGGNNLPGRRKETPITEPGEILLLDSNGNLTVRSELDDADQYELTLVRDEPPKPAARALDEKKDEPRGRAITPPPRR